ncbi:hypothetical protein ABT352_33215 [Streptosporangium sp. NPDC000563]|uniref:hypothetical protein n=1 Tax=Streptosporangium sp. NPDC000563 TaxID=3154366 RepID=UPI003329DAED
MPAVIATALLAAAGIAVATAAAGYVLGQRQGRRQGQRENARLTARLDTFTTILRPLPANLRAGRRGVHLSDADLATLALLVSHPGPDGEQLLALESTFHPENP